MFMTTTAGKEVQVRIEVQRVMRKFANGVCPNYAAEVYENGRHVATYNSVVGAGDAERMAWGRYAPVEEEYPCGLFKGPEDY